MSFRTQKKITDLEKLWIVNYFLSSLKSVGEGSAQSCKMIKIKLSCTSFYGD